MKKKLISKIGLGGVIAILTVCLLSSSAQDKMVSSNKQNQTTKLSKSIKSDGWKVPEVKDVELVESDIQKMQNLPVARKLYRLEQRVYTQLDFYSLNSNGSMTVETQDLAITTFITQNYNNKTFAYVIPYNPYGVSVNGSTGLIGIIISILYVDEDGDGKFETRYDKPDFPVEVPNWATKVQN